MTAFEIYAKCLKNKKHDPIPMSATTSVDDLIATNLRFVVRVAQKYMNSGVPIEELVGAGNIGLIIAARRYDPNKNVKFISYAVWWIRRYVTLHIGALSRLVYVPDHRRSEAYAIGLATSDLQQSLKRPPSTSEVSKYSRIDFKKIEESQAITMRKVCLNSIQDNSELLDIFYDKTQRKTDETTNAFETKVAIRKAIKNILSLREAQVVDLYYGITSGETMTMEDIGAAMSISKEGVRQVRNRSIRKLSKNKILRELMAK